MSSKSVCLMWWLKIDSRCTSVFKRSRDSRSSLIFMCSVVSVENCFSNSVFISFSTFSSVFAESSFLNRLSSSMPFWYLRFKSRKLAMLRSNSSK